MKEDFLWFSLRISCETKTDVFFSYRGHQLPELPNKWQ
jgi:hypothetical protein